MLTLLRSKMNCDNDGSPQSVFLSYSSGRLCGVTDKTNGTKIKIYSPSGWTRFGELYLNYLGWENTQVSSYFISNYFTNIAIGVDPVSNIEKYKGHDMLINQSGGNFTKLRFCNVAMDGVCCEIIGTYNALTVAGVDVDFFKLAIEFEMNAQKVILGLAKSGTWGSDPYDIDNCLDAYNVTYTTVDISNYESYTDACNAFDNELMTGVSGIVSYRWPWYNIYAGIHTYAEVYDTNNPNSAILAFNRYSNDTTSVSYASTDAAMKKSAEMGHYMVGYIIK